jgi:hypothetical protein
MPKGPPITDEVRRFIAEVNEEHPDWVAKEVKEEVQARLRQLGHQANPNWPGISTVQIELKKIRDERAKGLSPVDRPWSIGRLVEYDIPAEAVPKVLEIQATRAAYDPLTIREAKWVGRLHTIFEDIMDLAIWAGMYAEREKVCELANLEKDTSYIDSSIQSKLITILGYFPWLFKKTWVPDEYKKQVADLQTQEYEKIWGLNLDRPEFTLNGWLVYSHVLQCTILYNREEVEWPKESRELFILMQRQVAKNEGRLKLGAPGQYMDILEFIKTGVFRLKSYSKPEEVPDIPVSKEMMELIDKLIGGREKTAKEGQNAGSHSQEREK